jgi:hypothetical protein
MNYQHAVSRFSPYNRLAEVNQDMRSDTALLARRAMQRQVPAFILVNNRSEGFAPKTINDIGTKIVESLS